MHLDRSLVLQGILLSLVTGILSIKVETPRQTVSAPVGDEIEFICSSDLDKHSCIITPPYTQAYHMNPVAVYEDGRLIPVVGDSKECGIKITKVEEKDNGSWKCQVNTVEDGNYVRGFGSLEVTVAVPPKSVMLRSDGVAVTNERIQIEMAEPENPDPTANPTGSKVANSANARNFSCVAEQARPAPEFKWFIGDTEIFGKVEDTAENSNDNGISDFVQTLQYFPDSKHNDQVLKCEVEHSAFTERNRADKINVVEKKLEILFAPKSKDKPIHVYGLKEKQEDTVTIKFEANPMPTEGFWTLAGQEQNPIAFGTETIDKKFKSTFVNPTELNGEYSVTLTIKEVTAEMAGKTNKLAVTNDRGTTTYSFILSLGEKPKTENLGSGPVIGVIIVVAIVVLLIGLAIVARSKGILCFAGKRKDKEEDTEQAVEKEGSDTESAEDHQPTEAKKEAGDVETGVKSEEQQMNNNNSNKKSIGSKFSNIFAVVKKSVGKKNKEGLNESEIKLHEDDKKDGGDVTYAELDKSALEQGNRTNNAQGEDESTEYAEIKPQK